MSGAVFVLPGPATTPQGPVASMVSTAGWARAAERVLGRAWIVTPDGTIDPETAMSSGSDSELTAPSGRAVRHLVPSTAKTVLKDLRRARRARSFRIPPDEWRRDRPRFVWQRHELFQTAGLELARSLEVPSVLFVPATIVWEAEQWGTGRPGWGRWVERHGERPALAEADVIAAGTSTVAEQAVRIGADPRRVIVTPTGVDLDRFAGPGDRAATRARLGVGDRFVIGWVGSFRRFHALDRAVRAAEAIEGATLLLVGDGPERRGTEAMARRRGVDAVSTGTVPHDQLVELLAAMDVAVVLARADDAFHYSPLKVAEYLAAGVPVVAPDVGQLAERLVDGEDCLLVRPDDEDGLVRALRRVRDDRDLAVRLSDAGRRAAARSWSWDHRIRQVLSAVDDRVAT